LTFTSDSQIRLDLFLANESDLSRSSIQRLIKQGNCFVDDKVVTKPSFVLTGKVVVKVNIPQPITYDKVEPQSDISFDILYQDQDVAVINKPQNLTVHPSLNNTKNTLVNALMQKLDSLSGINGVMRPGIVHRLDKQTSGVMVIAKNDKAQINLSLQFANRQVKKIYVGVVESFLKTQHGCINAPISRNKQDRKKMAVNIGGKHATTKYNVLKYLDNSTLVKFELLTGRTHQIRVHCKHLGHPIVGDIIYGNDRTYPHQLLHALILEFDHPSSGKRLKFTAPLPNYFLKFINPKL
jgi:23S rRNA pseudouridine1911/1915/1917 synthase